MSKEIKSALTFQTQNGAKGQIATTMAPKELEDELWAAHVNDRPARLQTPEGTVLFHAAKNLIFSSATAVHANDIKIIKPGDINVPPGNPPLKIN